MTTKQIAAILDDNWRILEESSDPQLVAAVKLFAQHLDNPRSYVTLAGETSSGKSTLVNSFLGRRFLPAGAKPTTGTVTWLEHGLAPKERLLAINRDATVEELSYAQFCALSEKPDDKLLRLKAEFPEIRKGFKGLTVFDTPGFNAVISEHAEVLKEFLPESDVVVFPVSYKVGFGACDQELMSLVGDVRKRFGDFPVILVVNRVPEGVSESDKRIAEIRLHAEDTLHDKVQLIVVRTAMPTPDGKSVLPKTDHLWRAVAAVAFSDERMEALNARCKDVLCSFLNRRISEIEGDLNASSAGLESIGVLEKMREEFKEKEKASYKIVDRYMAKLENQLPKMFSQMASELIAHAEKEIDDSNKWFDVHQCQAYIFSHVLPFGCAEATKKFEAHVEEVFRQMDDELSEMANKIVHHINSQAQVVTNPNLDKLMLNLAGRIGEQIAGKVASSAIANVSGVGGTAAGVGNLVKMGVKQTGKLVGKTFSREVYTNIAKIFTKRVVQAMSAAFQVVVEFAVYAWDASKWQGELKEKVSQVVDNWKDEVCDELRDKMIPEYRESNYSSVKACYAAMIQDVDKSIAAARDGYSAQKVKQLKCDEKFLRESLSKLEK